MKRFRRGVLLIVVLALTAASVPAGATFGGAVCSVSGRIHFDPGLGTTSQVVKFTSSEGKIQCLGSVEGSLATGSGTFREWGVMEGTALAGTGSGVAKTAIPTLGGTKRVSFQTTFTYGPGVGVKQSDALVGPFAFTFVPTSGDGVTSPVTEIAFVGEFALQS